MWFANRYKPTRDSSGDQFLNPESRSVCVGVRSCRSRIETQDRLGNVGQCQQLHRPLFAPEDMLELMRFACGFLTLGMLFAAWCQPSISSGGVVNNASYFGKGAVGQGIAQGSLFAVFGQGFGPSGVVSTANNFPLGSTLAGVSVEIHSGSSVLSALPVYVTAGQIGAILPSATPVGSANVVVNVEGTASQPEPINVVTRNFGVFSVNQAGSGPAGAQNADANGSLTLNTVINSAQPGQTVVLWGTGAGPVSGNEAAGPFAGNLSAFNLTVYVGGIPATVLYRGRSGCCAGVDQINIVIPANSITGCYVPVVATGPALAGTAQNTQIPADHAVSNFTTLSISANGGACTDATGLSAAQLAPLEAGTAMAFGALEFERAPNLLMTGAFDSSAGGFGSYSPTAFFRTQGMFALPAPGTCTSTQMAINQTAPVDPAVDYSLNLAASLRVTWGNESWIIPRAADGSYSTYPTERFRSSFPAYSRWSR